MQPLEKSLRNKLEKTIKDARDIAEDAARAALEQLGVGEPTAYPHLTEADRKLRRKLRAHGRQLGNGRNAKGEQALDRLIEEVAYEHWHRMLFARFLAENNLLMYPDPDDPVAVTLEECEDLAADEGSANGWELASRFAARMLPQIFRPDSSVFQLVLPPEHQQKLEGLVTELPQQVFTASDSLGWVYQFWQAKKKDEVNASEEKIGARELPAVTQLFTEPYMVGFLLDNSLGAWWVRKCSVGSEQLSVKAREILQTAASEDELRQFFSRPGIPLTYLRFVKTDRCTLKTENASVFDSAHWMPASGWFEGWPNDLAELKTLDPCCGSGHFLVAAFLMLVPMRMELEGLTAREAVDRVLFENIHGLELDQRCVELAAFALALTAWRYPGAVYKVGSGQISENSKDTDNSSPGGYRPLPKLNLACTGLAVGGSRTEWEKLANGNAKLRVALAGLYEEFKDAPVLGSLIDPTRGGVAKLIGWDDLAGVLAKALEKERSDEQHEAGVAAHGLAEAGRLLARQYQWVITNVPYLKRGKHGFALKSFCEMNYQFAKADLATVFLDRCLELCVEGGTSSIVLPQNWLFLTTYKKFRKKLLKDDIWHLIARLGAGAFETISGEVVKVILVSLSRNNVAANQDELFDDTKGSNLIRGIDISESRTSAEKAAGLLKAVIKSVDQAKQLRNPDSLVSLEENEDITLLDEYADGLAGILNGDSPRFLRVFWEVKDRKNLWSFQQTTQKEHTDFGGLHNLVYYDELNGHLREARWIRRERLHDSDQRGQSVVGKKGVAVSSMGALPTSFFIGSRFDSNVATVVPKTAEHLPAVWCFCSSQGYNEAVRQIDQSLKVTNATLVKVPFNFEFWTEVALKKYPNGLPAPYSDDPTQWIFHGHPCGSVVWDETKKWTAIGSLRTDATVLQTAVARLLGYRWPAETDSDMALAEESRVWVKKSQGLQPFSDQDGVVCIPAVRGETSAADRLINLLAAAYEVDSGQNSERRKNTDNSTLKTDNSFPARISRLLAAADHGGKSLDTWLRDKFFIQHCKLFHHRPFIWHIWDGLHDGFAALVNYHKLDAKLLETLIYNYLGDWISRQKQDIGNGVDGAQEKLAAAEALKKKLELILDGEAPYDIFVRWKPIEYQPIGWNPDLNDGVRLNIRPFMTVGDVKKKGVGVLRDKPNIKWSKDRGKDVESASWYHLFKGDRINDHHLTLEEKRKAQQQRR